MEQDNLQQIDEAFENLPQEARDFLYKGAYATALAAIAQQFALADEQKQGLDLHILQVLLLLEHRDALLQYIQTIAQTPEQQKALIDAVEQQIILPVVAATNYIEEGIDNEALSAPSPMDVLETLKSRLTQTKTTAPSDARTPAEPQPAPKTIDPYRETV